MSLGILANIYSYISIPQAPIEAVVKKAANAVTTFTQGIFTQFFGKNEVVARNSFSYCLYPAGSKLAAKLSCGINTDLLLQEFIALVTNCTAQQVQDDLCKYFQAKISYGGCSKVCTLEYNGLLDTCFNQTLHATLPSCTPPGTSLISLYIAGGVILFSGAVVGGVSLCVLKKDALIEKIRTVFRCCCKTGYTKV